MMLRGDSEIKTLHVQCVHVPLLTKLVTMPTYMGSSCTRYAHACMHASNIMQLVPRTVHVNTCSRNEPRSN